MDKYLKMLKGYRINNIKRTLDLIMFDFVKKDEKELYLHVQTFLRVMRGETVLLCSNDLFRQSSLDDNDDFNWTEPDSSLFDENLSKHLNILEGLIIENCSIKNNDLILELQNNVKIELFIDTSYTEEKYRLFTDTGVLIEVNS